MNLKLTKIYFSVQDYLMILLGTSLYGFGFNAFILSNEIVTGGVSGIRALVFSASSGLIPASVSHFVINVALLVAVLEILGLKLLIKTIFGVFSLSASLSLFEWLLKGQPIPHDQPFMAIIIGAPMCGAGLGLVSSVNGSTGGTDIIGAVTNKYKNILIERILLFCDFFIISSSFFLLHSVDKIVFGFVKMVMSNYVLDMVLNGSRQPVQFLTLSQKYDEIMDRIIHDLGRDCTIPDGEGDYSRKPVKVVVLLAKKSESVSIFRIAKRIDHQAFIPQSIVRGVCGEGFDQIKTQKRVYEQFKALPYVIYLPYGNAFLFNRLRDTKLVLATNNQHELDGIRKITAGYAEIISLSDVDCHDDIPETADTLEGNVLLKARYIKEKFGYDCFADDTGLEVEVLDDTPGVCSARYVGTGHDSEANMNKLLSEMNHKKNRKARFRTVVALVLDGKEYIFDGIVDGSITTEKRGDSGFGYDPIFMPDIYIQTFAEMGNDTKNQISHRAKAATKLTSFLSDYNC